MTHHDAWRDQALCAQADPEAFFPDKAGSTAAAKAVCRRCPVQRDCLEEALTAPHEHGIWGGLSARQRRPVRRQLTRQLGGRPAAGSPELEHLLGQHTTPGPAAAA